MRRGPWCEPSRKIRNFFNRLECIELNRYLPGSVWFCKPKLGIPSGGWQIELWLFPVKWCPLLIVLSQAVGATRRWTVRRPLHNAACWLLTMGFAHGDWGSLIVQEGRREIHIASYFFDFCDHAILSWICYANTTRIGFSTEQYRTMLTILISICPWA